MLPYIVYIIFRPGLRINQTIHQTPTNRSLRSSSSSSSSSSSRASGRRSIMAPSIWRSSRRLAAAAGGRNGNDDSSSSNKGKRRGGKINSVEVPIPTHFQCPISLDLMKDPVILSTGITYDRQSIEKWVDNGNITCPVTNQLCNDLIPNIATRKLIQDWCVANRSYGVERIPTPRNPVTPEVAAEMLAEMVSASKRGDCETCGRLAVKIKATAMESERNRRCMVSNGMGSALAAAFQMLAAFTYIRTQTTTSVGVMEEILSALPETWPLEMEACSLLTTGDSLRSLVSILKHGGLAGRLNAILVLKEVTVPEKHVDVTAISKTEGLIEALVNLVKDPISPTTTKATLLTSFFLVSSSERAASGFAEAGMVHVLVDLLVNSDKSTTEKALGVLDGICSSELGSDMVHEQYALAVPVLVKKMFRVSDMATDFAVSVLWKISKSRGSGVERCLSEALQVGAFQKLLLLLQVGCGENTKRKVTELMKILNNHNHKGSLDCIDIVDLKGLKRA